MGLVWAEENPSSCICRRRLASQQSYLRPVHCLWSVRCFASQAERRSCDISQPAGRKRRWHLCWVRQCVHKNIDSLGSRNKLGDSVYLLHCSMLIMWTETINICKPTLERICIYENRVEENIISQCSIQ